MRYFNSIKVQLKLSSVAVAPAAIVFQFHKGTIKTENPTQADEYGKNFNSIKVQLKLIVVVDILKKSIFQFHKGTIKTRGSSRCIIRSEISIP